MCESFKEIKFDVLRPLTCEECIELKETFCRLESGTVMKIEDIPSECPIIVRK